MSTSLHKLVHIMNFFMTNICNETLLWEERWRFRVFLKNLSVTRVIKWSPQNSFTFKEPESLLEQNPRGSRLLEPSAPFRMLLITSKWIWIRPLFSTTRQQTYILQNQRNDGEMNLQCGTNLRSGSNGIFHHNGPPGGALRKMGPKLFP